MIGDESRTPPPTSPSLDVLLGYERDIVPQPEMVRARALARARATLREPGTMEPEATEIFPRSRVSRFQPRRLLIAAAAGILLMAGVAVAYQAVRRAESSAAAPKTPRAAQQPKLVPTVAEEARKPVAGSEAESKPFSLADAAELPSTSASSYRTGLRVSNEGRREELRLLVSARHADARNDYRSVLAVLVEHERRYPTGRLSEEREVLRVKALVGLKRADDARQVAARFRRQFPRSVLLHKIDDMLASLK